MKRLLCACVAMLLILGCSTTDPELTDASITDDNPVVGQRVYAQVYAITDDPPMTYEWSASGGTLDVDGDFPYTTYWTAPMTSGPYTITCRILDNDGNQALYTYRIEVRERSLQGDVIGGGRKAITMTKQSDSSIGGIWVSVRDDALRFVSSRSNEGSVWSKNFFTMLARTDSYTGYYTIWGAAAQGRDISVLTSDVDATLACGTCLATDTIQALAKDVLDDTILWVGTDSSLSYYDQVNDFWGTFLFVNVHDLSEGPDYVYAATGSGIYRLDGRLEPVYSGDSRAVLAVGNDGVTDVWSVTQGKIRKNGQNLASQPSSVVSSLDLDISGNVWCGKYRWDGSRWHQVPGLERVTVVKSVASTEGLIYFLSDSGILYRW
ncbi:MAG TPA: hypothetical protein PLP82_08495 [Deltaproteobacteria bacterium]|nr:hypothetical protein [Deltaproteobacteria bacterium]OQC29551.1 MAG: hypothetical protein BWX71_00032 [Deltaproteobacteria bacterium ADurb.Bin072]HNQ84495.1 hypothetical protein [Deltaproteobacteria bacterium]HNS88906.1 hypothetical protein [Deltaproteobacteria bacterium]HOA44242.1 hypothetical protein [Deltaproteobacteria bacterium]